MTQRIIIAADHSLALIYFLKSDIVSTLLKAGVEVVMLVDDQALPASEARFQQPGLIFRGVAFE